MCISRCIFFPSAVHCNLEKVTISTQCLYGPKILAFYAQETDFAVELVAVYFEREKPDGEIYKPG
jgi:hypothetical protein